MKILVLYLFFFNISTQIFAQNSTSYKILDVNIEECLSTYPNIIYFDDQLRGLKSEFEKYHSEEYNLLYWTFKYSLYPSADDAYNNTSPYPNDRIARNIPVDFKNPLVIYAQLNQNVTTNPVRIIVRFTYNYSQRPGGRNDFIIFGCSLDNDRNTYNLNKALLDIYSFNYNYDFSFYANFQDANSERNPIPESEWQSYEVSPQTNQLFLRVKFKNDYEYGSDCFSIFALTLETRKFHDYMSQKEFTFCGIPYIINGPVDKNNLFQFSNFEWFHNGVLKSSEHQVEIDALGEWTVYFDINTGCRSSITISVVEEDKYSYIQNVRSTMTQVIIEPTLPNKISSYSRDGINWQTSNIFNAVNELDFVFYIKNNLGCILGPYNYNLSNFFNFLSPNNDGVNDKWDIRSEFKNDINSIKIFDRSGRLIIEGLLKDILPWNGYINNYPLASGTYWYIIYNNELTLKEGSIMIKR